MNHTYDTTQAYPRDLVGYGEHVPHAQWPGQARVAVQFVLNYEEGGENSVLHGDGQSEAFLSDIAGAAPWPGMRHWNMESIYDYGARAGFWRLHRLFTEMGIPVTIYGVTSALARNPEQVAAMKSAGWEIASHGLKLEDDHHARFAVPFAAPLAAIRLVQTGPDGVLPVEIFARTNPEQPWTMLAAATLRQDSAGTVIDLMQGPWREYQIVADRRSAGFSAAPKVELLLDRVELVAVEQHIGRVDIGIVLQRRAGAAGGRRDRGPQPPAHRRLAGGLDPGRQRRPGLGARRQPPQRPAAATHRPAAPEQRSGLGTGPLAGASRRAARCVAAPQTRQRNWHRWLHHFRGERWLPLRHWPEPVAGVCTRRKPHRPDRALRQFDPARYRTGAGAQCGSRVAYHLLNHKRRRSV